MASLEGLRWEVHVRLAGLAIIKSTCNAHGEIIPYGLVSENFLSTRFAQICTSFPPGLLLLSKF